MVDDEDVLVTSKWKSDHYGDDGQVSWFWQQWGPGASKYANIGAGWQAHEKTWACGKVFSKSINDDKHKFDSMYAVRKNC